MTLVRFCWLSVLGLLACGGGDAGDDGASTGAAGTAQGGSSAAGAAGGSGKGGGTAGSGGAKAGSGGSATSGSGGSAGKASGGVAGASGSAGKSTAGSAGAGGTGGKSAAGAAGASGKSGAAGASGGGAAGASGAGGSGKSGAAGASGGGGGSAGTGGAGSAGTGGAGSSGTSGAAGTGGDAGAGGAGASGAGGAGAAGTSGAAGTGGGGGASGGCSPACGVGTVCDTVSGACVAEPTPPFLTFPISGDRVAGLPELRWVAGPAASTADARIELCEDPACATVIETLLGAGTASPSSTLSRRAVFVRAFGRTPRGDGTFIEGVTPSPVRVFTSSGRAAVSRAPVGIVPDLDRDGLADLGVGTATSNVSQIAVTLSGPSKTVRVDGPTEQPNGFLYGGFAKFMVLASDVDGDGYPEIATVDRDTAYPNPLTIVRLEYDAATKKLVERQRFDVALPQYHRLRQLAPLGDLDGDGYADVAVVSALPPVVGPSPGSGTLWLQTGVEIVTLFGGPLGWSRTATTQIVVPPAERTFENTPLPVRGVGDVDGDGVPDVAVGIQTSNPDSCLPMRRGRVEIRKGSASAQLDVVLATVTDWFDPTPLGDVDGDGRADVGVSREPHETREPIAPQLTCDASYTRTGFVAGEVRVLLGAPTAPLSEASYTMPVDNVAGCTNGFAFGPNFLVTGSLIGGGDLDGDGLDDLAIESPESHPGGASGCNSAGPVLRVLPGTSQATLSVAQQLATPEAGFGPFTDRVAIVGDLDASGRSALFVVGTLKGVAYAGPPGAIATVKQLTLADFGRTPLGGF